MIRLDLPSSVREAFSQPLPPHHLKPTDMGLNEFS
jgi:hypothetical protein